MVIISGFRYHGEAAFMIVREARGIFLQVFPNRGICFYHHQIFWNMFANPDFQSSGRSTNVATFAVASKLIYYVALMIDVSFILAFTHVLVPNITRSRVDQWHSLTALATLSAYFSASGPIYGNRR